MNREGERETERGRDRQGGGVGVEGVWDSINGH